MEIFKQLKKLGYKHYIDLTIEELDNLPIDNIEKRIEYSLVIDWLREKYEYEIIIFPLLNNNNELFYSYEILYMSINSQKTLKQLFKGEFYAYNTFTTYYEAREQSILETIEPFQKLV